MFIEGKVGDKVTHRDKRVGEILFVTTLSYMIRWERDVDRATMLNEGCYDRDSPYISQYKEPHKVTAWFNVYERSDGSLQFGNSFSSKEEAVRIGESSVNYIDTVILEYTETLKS